MDNLRNVLRASNAGAILRELQDKRILETVLPELSAMDIKSSAHKDMFEHSIRVFENAVELTDGEADDVLRVAALLHDMGKPKTRKLVKGGATFLNHEGVGAKMARRVLPGYGYTEDEVRAISTLIKLHMRGHSFKTGWTDSAVRRLITDAGSREQVDRLTVLFAADATTSNRVKRERYRANALELRDEALRVMADDERRAMRPALNGNEVMELTGLKPGRELGKIMKFLNSDEGIALTRDEAVDIVLAQAEWVD